MSENNFSTFKNIAELEKYTEMFRDRFTPGEMVIIHDEEDKEHYYLWNNDEWNELKVEGTDTGITMSMYDLNEQIISQLPDHTSEEKEEDIKLINDFYQLKQSKYYMLLCKEISYFTIFTTYGAPEEKEFEVLGSAVFCCLEDLGTVRSVENIDDNEIEIWVNRDGQIICLHLFDYAEGVVPFGFGG